MRDKKYEAWIKRNSHYSESGSKQFWKRINGIRDVVSKREMYGAGVLLQNMEATVLSWLYRVDSPIRCKKHKFKRSSKPGYVRCACGKYRKSGKGWRE